MTDIAKLGLAVESRDVKEARRHVEALERSATSLERIVDKLGDEAKKTDDDIDGMGQSSQLASRGFNLAASAAASFIAALGVGEIVQTADSIALLRGRIGLYTDTTAEADAIVGQLFDRSRQMGASFDALAETYARIVPAQDAMGLSTGQLLDLTEAVGTAFQVSGASAEEARNATLQLSQAFASGELRGEELRSVMEQGQRIMLALGNQTGKTTGELRAMAEAGQLTSDVVANALLAELPQLRQEMEDLPLTAGRGFQSLQTGFTELIANIDQAVGATERLGGIFFSLSEAVDGVNERFSTDLSVQLNVTRQDLENLTAQLTGMQRVLADPSAAGIAAGELASYQARVATLEKEIQELTVQEQSLTMAIEARAEAQRRADAYQARFGVEEEVDPLEDVAEVLAALRRESEVVGLTRAQRELYNQELRLGRDLTEDEEVAIRDVVAQIERMAQIRGEMAAKVPQEIQAIHEMSAAKAQEYEREEQHREEAARLAEYQLEQQIRLAELAGDRDVLTMLETERDVRREINELVEAGISQEEARSIAQSNAQARLQAARHGELKEAVHEGLDQGLRAFVESGDLSAIGRGLLAEAADHFLEDLVDQGADILSGLIFGQAEATAAGVAQGSAAGAAMQTAMATGERRQRRRCSKPWSWAAPKQRPR
ncbi:tape measure protein [Maricaulis sp. MIT060901]|uniref:tape measure protein n=1 Tax=Maricaulis sp. MIT060901 TaxID=3096993 RepID=UPI00399954B7